MTVGNLMAESLTIEGSMENVMMLVLMALVGLVGKKSKTCAPPKQVSKQDDLPIDVDLAAFFESFTFVLANFKSIWT